MGIFSIRAIAAKDLDFICSSGFPYTTPTIFVLPNTPPNGPNPPIFKDVGRFFPENYVNISPFLFGYPLQKSRKGQTNRSNKFKRVLWKNC